MKKTLLFILPLLFFPSAFLTSFPALAQGTFRCAGPKAGCQIITIDCDSNYHAPGNLDNEVCSTDLGYACGQEHPCLPGSTSDPNTYDCDNNGPNCTLRPGGNRCGLPDDQLLCQGHCGQYNISCPPPLENNSFHCGASPLCTVYTDSCETGNKAQCIPLIGGMCGRFNIPCIPTNCNYDLNCVPPSFSCPGFSPSLCCPNTTDCPAPPPTPTPRPQEIFDPCRHLEGTSAHDSCDSCTQAGNAWTSLGCLPTSVPRGFAAWLLGRSIAAAGGIAFLLMLYASSLVMTARGDPQKLQAGKELLTAAIVGLLMLIFSLFVIRFVIGTALGLPLVG